MRRRDFGRGLLGLTGIAGTGATEAQTDAGTQESRTLQSDQIEQMLFPSSGGLLDANEEPLTDDSLVAVWAESTAVITDDDGNGDAVDYPDDVDIPVVCVDDNSAGTAVGIGGMIVNDGDLVPELEGDDPLGDLGNEEFLLNLYDEYTDGDTILWDESHSQFYDLASFQNFEAYAEDNGYSLQATSDITADLSGADAIVITSPSDSFSDAELTALSDFLSNGGLVVMHNQSDFNDFDETDNFNAIASNLGIGFRFNDSQVVDDESNVGVGYLPLTSNFNDSDFSLFQDREGIVIDLQAGKEYDVSVTGVADGDTCDVEFNGDEIGLATNYEGTVRVLGIDTPESAGIAQTAERPEEWEGLAYDLGGVDDIDEFVFDSTCSLLDENEEVLTDDGLVAIYAEPAATNQDADGNGDAISYPEDTDIPLVAVQDSVVGVGAPFITDEELNPATDNEEFMLNVYDQVIDGDTVLWDEGHGQFYDLASASSFESYAEDNGYDIQATSDIENDLSGANAVVITSPSQEFSPAEVDELISFIAEGGTVILHDQADFDNFDATANINDIAADVGADFRFNDDQVIDEQNNTGQPFVPTTGNFDSSSPLFDTREGIDESGGPPRTTDHLTTWASNASDFAIQALDGKDVTLFFDENESLRDPTRLLAYIRYDDTGDSQRDTLYNKKVIEEGYARAYGSGLSRHEEFWSAESEAREQNRGVWQASDLADASPYRDRRPEDLFAPEAATIDATSGASVDDYATLYASESATSPQYSTRAPLCGRDTANRTAVAGSLLVDESYEQLEGFDVDTSDYENYAFVTTILDSLSDGEGPVYVDGGHGQFGAGYALSSEDMAFYQRHLEGRQQNLEQINDLTSDRLANAQALIITTPATELTSDELDAVESFRDNGGAVFLFGSAAAPDDAIANLNDVAAALGTPLRVNTDQVTDDSNNLNDNETVVTTKRISLIEKYTNESGVVGIDGLREAIGDFTENYIDISLLRAIIQAFTTGDPV